MTFAREMLEGMPSSASYKANQLRGLLLGLQRNQVSGIVCIEVAERSSARRVLVFQEGALAYAGKSLPGPRDFVVELSRYLQIGVIDTVLEFAAKRSSVQSLLATMVQIEVLQWADIKAAMRKQAADILEELLTTSGTVTFEPADTTKFDLRYDEKELGFGIDALLLESDLHKKRQAGSEASPVAPPDRQQQQQPAENLPVILSVDDSSIAQALVKRVLGKKYHTIACTSALEALSKLDNIDNVALMLVDVTMPDMDGLEFCRTVRKIERFKSLPIVMITARDSMVDRLRGRLAGTNHYLIKPVKPADLLAVVALHVPA